MTFLPVCLVVLPLCGFLLLVVYMHLHSQTQVPPITLKQVIRTARLKKQDLHVQQEQEAKAYDLLIQILHAAPSVQVTFAPPDLMERWKKQGIGVLEELFQQPPWTELPVSLEYLSIESIGFLAILAEYASTRGCASRSKQILHEWRRGTASPAEPTHVQATLPWVHHILHQDETEDRDTWSD
jgi:hypothetical protein